MQSDSEGIGKLRTGSLILSIAALIIIITPIVLLVLLGVAESSLKSFLTSFSNATNTTSFSNITSTPSFQSFVSSITAAFEISGTLLILGYIITFIGNLYFRQGFKTLTNFGRSVWTGSAGALISLIALILTIISILVFVGFIMAVINSTNLNSGPASIPSVILGFLAIPFVGLALGGIPLIILVIGNILLGIGLYQVGSAYNESVTEIGGIFVLVASILTIPILLISLIDSSIFLIIPILFFVGFILAYIGLGRVRPMSILPTIPPVTSIQPTQPMSSIQPTTPQIYQVGQGVIRGDGSAFITLYTSTQAMISSVRVDGTTLNAVMVNPVILQPGQNTITIKFNTVYQLTPGNSYVISIGVKAGGNLVEVKAITTYYP